MNLHYSNNVVFPFFCVSSSQKSEETKIFENIYRDAPKFDTKSLPFRRFIQLYSRNSGRHVRINADRSVDAKGENGDKYGTN